MFTRMQEKMKREKGREDEKEGREIRFQLL